MRQSLSTRWFDDFFVGERFALPRRTLTQDVLRAFAEASGDAQPLRTIRADSDAIGYGCILSSGFLATVQTVACPGVLPFLIEDSLVGLLDQSSRYVRPVAVGDTLIPVLQVTELQPNNGGTGIVGLRSTVHNQNKALVIEGTQRWVIRTRPAH